MIVKSIASTLSGRDYGWGNFFRDTMYLQGPTSSGVTVTESTAMQSTAVYACVTLLSGAIGSLPVNVFRRVKLEGLDGKVEAPDYPTAHMIRGVPNEYGTRSAFREAVHGYVETMGNGYAEIETQGDEATGLYPRSSCEVLPKMDGRTLYYEVRDAGTGTPRDVPARNMLHIPNFGGDGICGYSTIRLFREAIGLALAAEKYGASFFGGGAQPSGVLKFPARLQKEQVQEIRGEWDKVHRGAQKIAILGGNLDWQSVGMTNDDAQFLQTRQFSAVDIAARIFGVPPFMVGEPVASWNNAEQLGIFFVQYTLGRRVVKWEQELTKKLILPEDQGEYFVEFNLNGLLRGDLKARQEYYTAASINGWLTLNEIRVKENDNPFPGGNAHRAPLNTGPIDANGETAAASDVTANQAPNQKNREGIIESFRQMVASSAGPAIRFEANKIGEKAGEMDSLQFRAWFQGFAAGHEPYVISVIGSALEAGIGMLVAVDMHDADKWRESALTLAKGAAGFHVERLRGWVNNGKNGTEVVEEIRTAGAEGIADYCCKELFK